ITSLIRVRTSTRISRSREELLALASNAEGSREILVRLFEWDILTSSADGSVTLASQAIVNLDVIQRWVREDYEKLKLRADLEELAQQWVETGRPENLRPGGETLARYRSLAPIGDAPTSLLEAATKAVDAATEAAEAATKAAEARAKVDKKRERTSVVLGLGLMGAVLVLIALAAFAIRAENRSRELQRKYDDLFFRNAQLEGE